MIPRQQGIITRIHGEEKRIERKRSDELLDVQERKIAFTKFFLMYPKLVKHLERLFQMVQKREKLMPVFEKLDIDEGAYNLFSWVLNIRKKDSEHYHRSLENYYPLPRKRNIASLNNNQRFFNMIELIKKYREIKQDSDILKLLKRLEIE